MLVAKFAYPQAQKHPIFQLGDKQTLRYKAVVHEYVVMAQETRPVPPTSAPEGVDKQRQRGRGGGSQGHAGEPGEFGGGGGDFQDWRAEFRSDNRQ